MITFADLPAAFSAARAEASAAALGVVEDMPPNTCRYCGKFMRPWGGRRSDGHVRCIVPLAFQRAVFELWWTSPTLTPEQIAEACGVSASTVRGWIANVERMGRAA